MMSTTTRPISPITSLPSPFPNRPFRRGVRRPERFPPRLRLVAAPQEVCEHLLGGEGAGIRASLGLIEVGRPAGPRHVAVIFASLPDVAEQLVVRLVRVDPLDGGGGRPLGPLVHLALCDRGRRRSLR